MEYIQLSTIANKPAMHRLKVLLEEILNQEIDSIFSMKLLVEVKRENGGLVDLDSLVKVEID